MRRPRPVFVAALVLCSLACDGPAAPDAGGTDAGGTDAGAIDAGAPTRAWIRDEAGGVLILRGTNVEGASKWTEGFLPPSYQTVDDFRPLVDELGFSAVRFLVFWEAVEPERGVYDDAYLAEVRARVEAAGAAGLYVIVDMHQDVFGAGFGGDGAPRWACDEALYASFTPPDEWFQGYFEPEVAECFDRLWTDPTTRAAYAAAWARVARAVAGAEGLIAYELMNEPFWGTATVRTFERSIAPVAYAEWLDAIRAEDPAPYVMMGPASAANIGLSSFLVPPDRERLIYGPHLYPPSLERGLGWTGSADDVLDLADVILDDALRMGLPVVVGETGARRDVDGALTFLDQAYDAFDARMLGATQWEGGRGGEGSYDIFELDGTPSSVGRAIARPYPTRVAGEPRGWSWDGAELALAWTEDGSASGETIVALPAVAFPSGADASLADGGEVRIEGTRAYVPSIGGDRSLTIRAR
ncbi:MAG: cellulase family glycosylhydrolase [Sandaracinaceae bacterium]|nr:cellulase family glycosylhydrolase [Sandaracinaceae bacterium]